ncbi:MAG: FHA domain-containing protein, partial [Isosphaeraceae bacterium]
QGEVIVRDLGSTNGIRLNGQRVEFGRLRPGDELSIAHIRFRLDTGQGHEATLAEGGLSRGSFRDRPRELNPHEQEIQIPVAAPPPAPPNGGSHEPPAVPALDEGALAMALRNALPSEVAKHYAIKVILQVEPSGQGAGVEESHAVGDDLPEGESSDSDDPAGPESGFQGKVKACRPD